MATARRARGTPPWKSAKPVPAAPTKRAAKRLAQPAAAERTSWRERVPDPVELTDAELALRRRNIRRWGWLFATLCFVLVIVALVVMLSLNRGTADLGLAVPRLHA